MGGMNYRAGHPPETRHAVEAIIETFRAAPGEITLVTLGPLSNIATALLREPKLAEWVKGCYVMGGAACSVGNITPAAEYNIWCDPEAARILFPLRDEDHDGRLGALSGPGQLGRRRDGYGARL